MKKKDIKIGQLVTHITDAPNRMAVYKVDEDGVWCEWWSDHHQSFVQRKFQPENIQIYEGGLFGKVQ